VLQAAWRVAQQRPGSDQDVRRAALLLARAYAAVGETDEAKTLFRRALDDFARHAPGSMAEVSAREHWATFLAQQGDAAAAEAEYRAVIAGAGSRLFEAVPRAHLGLAKLAAARGDLDAAWRLAEQARADAERMTAGHDVRLHADVWRLLARLALQRGDSTTAAQWAERALAASQRTDGVDAPTVNEARASLGAARRASVSVRAP
jgi:tetratricopeptide (TPR) repeat protein